MSINFLKLGLVFFGVASIFGCAESMPVERWYTQDQASMGKPLYQKYCADCHGYSGQGGQNWDRPNKDGSYPPQPLNGSGHSWHHSLSWLENKVAKGSTHPGAVMPGFADVLDVQQRKSVIAAFQDFWNDRVYAAWLKRAGM